MIQNEEKVPKFMWEHELLKKAIDKWGESAQVSQMVEECAELIVALNHYYRGRITEDEVVEELVDVQIMLEQMLVIFDESKFVVKYDEKLKRLEKRLEK